MKFTNCHKTNETGLVSIVVALILMVVLSLITISFAKLSGQEQRQSLDRQLLSQAYYAAETGINDAQDYIKTQLAASSNVDAVADCTSFLAGSRIIDDTTSYPCLLIEPNPNELEKQRVNTYESVVFPLKPRTGVIDTLTISWKDPDQATPNYSAGCATTSTPSSLPPLASWICPAGLLRLDLTPVNSLSRDTLISSTLNLLLYPAQSAAGISSSTPGGLGDTHGAMPGVSCSNASPSLCSFTLTGIGGLSNAEGFYIRLRPIYRAAYIKIVGTLVGGGSVNFVGAQAIVDVTGKANDVLKRLIVHVPLTPNTTVFDYAIQSVDSICKKYGVIPPSQVQNYSNYPSDPACALP